VNAIISSLEDDSHDPEKKTAELKLAFNSWLKRLGGVKLRRIINTTLYCCK